jgi:hypothetical protein
MGSGKTIVNDHLAALRSLYSSDKRLYQQRRHLIQAITYLPGVPKSEAYSSPSPTSAPSFDEIISGIRKHGNLAT